MNNFPLLNNELLISVWFKQMADPLTISVAALAVAQFVGGVGIHVGYHEAHHFYRHFLERWREGIIGHPHNHDLEEASEKSLRAAVLVLVLELAGKIEPEKSWFTRKAEKLPLGRILAMKLFPGAKEPQKKWLNALRKAVEGKPFCHLHRHLNLDEQNLQKCFTKGDVCEALGPGLADAILEWAHVLGLRKGAHSDFEKLVREGWSAGEDSAHGKRITLAEVYCLFFREHLKTNPKVFRILVTDTLTAMGGKLDSLGDKLTGELKTLRDQITALAATPAKLDFTAFEDWLDERLGEIKNLLTSVQDKLDDVARSQDELKRQQGDILVALTTLKTEVVRGHPAAQPALDALTAHIASLARKLDYLIGGLPITPFQLPDPPTHELELLHAKHRSVDLLGRATDLDALSAWLETAEPISARLLVGGAGTGKTRLGFELLLRVNVELPRWQAGVLPGTDLRRVVERTHSPDFNWPAPTLLVVDYAQTLAGPLAELLRALTHKRRAGLPPLRLLLLERQPGNWFDDLLHQEDSAGPCPVRSLFHPPAPVPLTPLPPGELRRRMLTDILAKTATLTGKIPSTLPTQGQDPAFEASLGRNLFEQPLNLMMAALAVSELGLLHALNRPKREMVYWLAEREERRLSRALPHGDKDPDWPGIRHVAACTTICHGLDQTEFLAVAEREIRDLGYAFKDGSSGAYLRLLGCIPNSLPHRVAGILPDLVGEAFAYQVLSKQLSEAAHCSCLVRLAEHFGDRVCAFLLRGLMDFPGLQEAWFAGWLEHVRPSLEKGGTRVKDVLKSEMATPGIAPTEYASRLVDSFELKARSLGTSSSTILGSAWLRENINLAIASK